jgi:hypothetical protein
MERPMPRAAPVTSANFPSRSTFMFGQLLDLPGALLWKRHTFLSHV